MDSVEGMGSSRVKDSFPPTSEKRIGRGDGRLLGGRFLEIHIVWDGSECCRNKEVPLGDKKKLCSKTSERWSERKGGNLSLLTSVLGVRYIER